jgi:hypothetical protein
MRDVQAHFSEAVSQSDHGILQSNGFHGDKSIEEVEANGLYVLHHGSSPSIIIFLSTSRIPHLLSLSSLRRT